MNEVSIKLDGQIQIKAFLAIPEGTKTIVIFAHGSGSGRHSPRNQFVAQYLLQKGLAFLLLDLLTPEEEAIDEETRQFRFDIPMLAERLVKVAGWMGKNRETAPLAIAYFGSSTGAAAALIAAAKKESRAVAVVSRGGRPDLAASVLPNVRAATLLIVGGDDEGVIELNEQAYALLACEKKLTIVPGATHLFEESGKLEEVARLAAEWFLKH